MKQSLKLSGMIISLLMIFTSIISSLSRFIDYFSNEVPLERLRLFIIYEVLIRHQLLLFLSGLISFILLIILIRWKRTEWNLVLRYTSAILIINILVKGMQPLLIYKDYYRTYQNDNLSLFSILFAYVIGLILVLVNKNKQLDRSNRLRLVGLIIFFTGVAYFLTYITLEYFLVKPTNLDYLLYPWYSIGTIVLGIIIFFQPFKKYKVSDSVNLDKQFVYVLISLFLILTGFQILHDGIVIYLFGYPKEIYTGMIMELVQPKINYILKSNLVISLYFFVLGIITFGVCFLTIKNEV